MRRLINIPGDGDAAHVADQHPPEGEGRSYSEPLYRFLKIGLHHDLIAKQGAGAKDDHRYHRYCQRGNHKQAYLEEICFQGDPRSK